jgi:hypothetical protein
LDEKQKAEREKLREKEKVESLEERGGRKKDSSLWNKKKSSGAEGRMSEVKTNKEYQAFLSEIDTAKSEQSDGRRNLQIMDEIDDSRRISPKGKRTQGSPWKK